MAILLGLTESSGHPSTPKEPRLRGGEAPNKAKIEPNGR